MKLRNGFVSNSSSSSFVIALSELTEHEKEMIYNHIEIARKNGWLHENGVNDCYDADGNWISSKCGYEDEWTITEESGFLKGNTFMDNFDMEAYLELIGINTKRIHISKDG